MSVQEFDRCVADQLAQWFGYDQHAALHTARRTGLTIEDVDFGGSLQAQWGQVVDFARRQGRMLELMQRALEDYGANNPNTEQFKAWIAEEAARKRRPSGVRAKGAPVSPTSDDLLHQVAQDIAVMQRDLHYTKAEIEELRRALERLPPGYMTLQVLVGLLVLTQIGVIVFMAVTHL